LTSCPHGGKAEGRVRASYIRQGFKNSSSFQISAKAPSS
jgi:hypothetical protein